MNGTSERNELVVGNKTWIALAAYAVLALLAWQTMEAGQFQQITWLILGLFAVRTVLHEVAARRAAGEVTDE